LPQGARVTQGAHCQTATSPGHCSVPATATHWRDNHIELPAAYGTKAPLKSFCAGATFCRTTHNPLPDKHLRIITIRLLSAHVGIHTIDTAGKVFQPADNTAEISRRGARCTHTAPRSPQAPT